MTNRRPMQKTIEDLIEQFGMTEAYEKALEQRGLFHLRIENPPYFPLVVEVTWEGFISVAHYDTSPEYMGDAMRDPEIVFSPTRGWRAVEITQDKVGHYKRLESGKYSPGIEQLANTWALNIRAQGFANGKPSSSTHPSLLSQETA